MTATLPSVPSARIPVPPDVEARVRAFLATTTLHRSKDVAAACGVEPWVVRKVRVNMREKAPRLPPAERAAAAAKARAMLVEGAATHAAVARECRLSRCFVGRLARRLRAEGAMAEADARRKGWKHPGSPGMHPGTRARLLNLLALGTMPKARIAAVCGVSEHTVYRYARDWAEMLPPPMDADPDDRPA